MRNAALLAIGVALLAPSTRAQIDCSMPPGCVTTKYGLGELPDYRDEFVDPFAYTAADFGPDLPVCVGGPTPGQNCSVDEDCGSGGRCNVGVGTTTRSAT
jgi:hypothetical protein